MKKILFVLIISFIASCATTDGGNSLKPSYKKPGTYNLKIIIYNTEINNPENDRRSYYKVYINKIETGRTSIGLESQKKVFETRVSVNNHLVKIQKYVLDEEEGKYVKLNNINQPKPSYKYIDVPDERIVVIEIKQSSNNNVTDYKVYFEEN